MDFTQVLDMNCACVHMDSCAPQSISPNDCSRKMIDCNSQVSLLSMPLTSSVYLYKYFKKTGQYQHRVYSISTLIPKASHLRNLTLKV